MHTRRSSSAARLAGASHNWAGPPNGAPPWASKIPLSTRPSYSTRARYRKPRRAVAAAPSPLHPRGCRGDGCCSLGRAQALGTAARSIYSAANEPKGRPEPLLFLAARKASAAKGHSPDFWKRAAAPHWQAARGGGAIMSASLFAAPPLGVCAPRRATAQAIREAGRWAALPSGVFAADGCHTTRIASSSHRCCARRAVDGFNEEWEIEDTLGEVAWYVEGPGYAEPAVGTATFYYAPFSRVNDSGCVQVVVPDSGTRGLDGYTNDQLSFNVRIPSAVRAWHANGYSLGTLGPPDTSIGTASDFWFQTLPDNVNFQRVPFRKSISQQTFAWPDGTSYAVGQSTRGFLVQDLDGPNFYGDLVSSGGPWRIERLLNQVYQSCQFNVTQSLQFYAEGDWHTYATPAHPRSFSGDTFKARVGWSDIWGNWPGPYQEPGL